MNDAVPMVLIPVAGDQPANAARCAALGLGRVVTPDERTPETIRAAVRAVLGDRGYAERALRLRQEIQRLPELGRAVELLETIVRETAGVERADGSVTNW
jgi:UDP:flavonoid glycosyltransferase YjiC (YdhE family)